MHGLAVVIVLVAILFWIYQLIDIISMKDADFEGRNDKLIFFLLVFFGTIFGAIFFAFWKGMRRKTRRDEDQLTEALTRKFKEFIKEERLKSAAPGEFPEVPPTAPKQG